MPPASWFDTINAPKKVADGLKVFATRCDFFARLINTFSLYAQNPTNVSTQDWQQWVSLFDNPIEYPPPDGHPLKADNDLLSGPNHFHIT
jgi:hypothetical protein